MQVRVNEETVKQHKVQANRNLSVIEKAAKTLVSPAIRFAKSAIIPMK